VKLFAFDQDDAPTQSRARHREQVIREARTLCQVEHPNIVRFYSILADSAAPVAALAMEYLPGASLADRLKASGALPIADVVGVGIAVASALDAGHRAGIVHRDVKPANVMESPGGYKLIDFGIATASGGGTTRTEPSARRHVLPTELPHHTGGTRMTLVAEGDGSSTSPAGIVANGTVGYIDPECVAWGLEATTSSDLYSFGALLFECITGHLPAASNRGSALSGAVLDGREKAPRLSEVVPSVPARLGRLVDALLLPERARRPANAGEVLAELEAVARELLDAGGAESNEPAKGRGPVAMAVVATLALVLGGWALLNRHSTAAEPMPTQRETTAVVSPAAAPTSPPLVPAAAPVADPVVVRGSITVPRGARVTVDGSERAVDGQGVLMLAGQPGTTFRVQVELGGKRRATDVVLTRDGRATPDRVDLPSSRAVTRDPPARVTPAAAPVLVPKDEF
jgi:serine/threonine protein kinase